MSIVDKVHTAAVEAMEAITDHELTVAEMQNLRADARALADWADQKIRESQEATV